MKLFLGKVKGQVATVKEEKPVPLLKDMSVKKRPKNTTDPNHTKLIIVSDNHMKTDRLKKILEYHVDEADYFIHCGDSNLDHDHEIMKPFIAVKGNTDFLQKYQEEEVVKLANGELIWIVHGHLHQVNGGVDALLQAAKMFEVMPAIILYGHTHRVDVRVIEGCLIINPGSIASPRDGMIHTYVKLVVTPEFYEVILLDAEGHRKVRAFLFPR